MNSDTAYAGPIPAIYDRLLVPMIFASFAEDLAERVAALRPARVLEIAAGTGAVTRAMAKALPATVEIVATDLNQAMLDHAAATIASPRIAWRQADALALPFADQSFDAAVCQFGVMFFPDSSSAFARRAAC